MSNKGLIVTRCAHVAIVMMLVLTACDSPPTPASTREPVTITFMTFSAAPWQELIAAFEETHPDVHVELYYRLPPDGWPQQADVVLGFSVVPQDLIDRGWILDLTPLIASDERFGTEDIYPGVLSIFQQEGHTWAVPVAVELWALVYSPDVFHKVGAPLPGPQWTWGDIAEAARLLSGKTADGSTCYSVLDEYTLSNIAVEWIAERGGGLYREEGGSIIPALDRPEVQQAVADWLAIRDQVKAMVNGSLFLTTEEILDHVEQGTVGIAVLPLRDLASSLPRHPTIAIAPLPPGYFVGSRVLYSSSELAISAGSTHPDAAWEWVHFVSRHDIGGGFWPARKSVAETSDFQRQKTAEIAQVALASLENHVGRLRLAPQVARAIYGGLSRALVFIRTPQDIASALTAVQQEAVTAIRSWQEERASVTPVPVSVSASLPAKEEEQTIEFRITNTLYEPLYTAAAEVFTKEHPGWRVTVSFLQSKQPGCLATYIPNNALEQLLTWRSLADLSPLAAPRPFSEDEFIPQAIAAARWRSRLYAVPATVKPLVLYYNPEVFQRAGMELPSADWTAEDILTAAERIEATSYEVWGYLVRGSDVPFLLEQQGLYLFTNERPPRPRFTDPDVMNALERLRALRGAGVGLVTPYSEAVSLLMSGKVGMWFNVFDYWPAADQLAMATGVSAVRLRSGTRLPMQVGIYGLYEGAVHPQACWEWINFLVQQGVTPQDELPALRRLADSDATRQRLGDELFTAYMEALRQDKRMVARDTTVEDWATWWFIEAIKNATSDDLEVALETAQQRAETFIACLEPGGGADLEQAQTCAEQADPNHPLAALAP